MKKYKILIFIFIIICFFISLYVCYLENTKPNKYWSMIVSLLLLIVLAIEYFNKKEIE